MSHGNTHKQHRCFRLWTSSTRNTQLVKPGHQPAWNNCAPISLQQSFHHASQMPSKAHGEYTTCSCFICWSRHVRLAVRRLTKSLSKKSCMLLSISKHFIFNQQVTKDLLNRCRRSAAEKDRWINCHKANDDKYCAESPLFSLV